MTNTKIFSAQELLDNWNKFNGYIEKYISGNRKNQLLDFYKKYEDRLSIYPASNNPKYHSCMVGGYIFHVNNVIENSLILYKVWERQGANMKTFTLEELIFSAINHDLGKMGDMYNDTYLPSQDKWRIENLGELYTFNTKLGFMSVPDRSLFLLQQHEIGVSENEWIAIKTHDGLYDPANEVYLKSFNAETKPRTVLPYILHQADLMSAVIEFQEQYALPKGLLKQK
jgi:hypothetical protein